MKYEYLYEYKRDVIDLMRTLKELGLEGWELVGFTTDPETNYFRLILKRPLHE